VNHPRPISDLVHRCIGRAGVAIGGGVSLPPQYRSVESLNAVHAAANQHGCVMGYRVDYIVSVDPDTSKIMRSYRLPVISPRRASADYLLFPNQHTGFNSSGVWAAFVLWLMGCAPIILTGMDCFSGGTYCHDLKAKSSGTGSSVEQHLRKWHKLKASCPRGAFRSAGGPTEKVFPRYDPNETGFAIPAREQAMRECSGVIVEVKTAADLLADRSVGERVECSQSEARHVIGKRFAVKVAGALPA
jgi:hypothetical protein